MHWVRSFPSYDDRLQHPRRAYVVDPNTDVLEIAHQDYTPLGRIRDDILLLEWDVAVSREDLEAFEAIAERNRHSVLVAAYELYHVEKKPVWAHRRYNHMTGTHRWVNKYEDYADLFSFGMIYLPRPLITEFLEAPAPDRGRPYHLPERSWAIDKRMTAETFSMWHFKRYNPVRIIWGVFPVHLHFEPAEPPEPPGTMRLR